MVREPEEGISQSAIDPRGGAFREALDPDKLERLAGTRSIPTASSNGCSPCCCGSRTCDAPTEKARTKMGRAYALPMNHNHGARDEVLVFGMSKYQGSANPSHFSASGDHAKGARRPNSMS